MVRWEYSQAHRGEQTSGAPSMRFRSTSVYHNCGPEPILETPPRRIGCEEKFVEFSVIRFFWISSSSPASLPRRMADARSKPSPRPSPMRWERERKIPLVGLKRESHSRNFTINNFQCLHFAISKFKGLTSEVSIPFSRLQTNGSREPETSLTTLPALLQ